MICVELKRIVSSVLLSRYHWLSIQPGRVFYEWFLLSAFQLHRAVLVYVAGYSGLSFDLRDVSL